MRKEVFVYFLVFLVLGIPATTLGTPVVQNTTKVSASPLSINSHTVDGDPSDWVGVAGGDNTWVVSNGEGIWNDAAFDDTGNGSYIYPNCTHTSPAINDSKGWDGYAYAYTGYPHGGMCDLREFRVTGNDTCLFMMFRVENMGSQAIVNEYNVPGGTHEPWDPRFPYVNATGFGKYSSKYMLAKM